MPASTPAVACSVWIRKRAWPLLHLCIIVPSSKCCYMLGARQERRERRVVVDWRRCARCRLLGADSCLLHAAISRDHAETSPAVLLQGFHIAYSLPLISSCGERTLGSNRRCPMTLTDYEMERQRRVEENRRRMEQLGLPQVRPCLGPKSGAAFKNTRSHSLWNLFNCQVTMPPGGLTLPVEQAGEMVAAGC